MSRISRVQFGQRGFLRPQMIQLLERQPMNGIDIMNALQKMSHGWYRPSPGSVYPLLEQLEKEGLTAKNKDGKYELTAAYRKQSDADEVARALSVMESDASYLEDLEKSDPASLSKYAVRIEKLTGRLDTLNDALKSRRVPS